MRSHWDRAYHATKASVGSGMSAGHTALYLLYLSLAACIFGASLLYHVIWLSRCRDAIEVSHTASTLLKRYSDMDGTRAAELKVSLNDTISRVLDDKLPKIISRACVGGIPRILQVANFADTKVFRPILTSSNAKQHPGCFSWLTPHSISVLSRSCKSKY